MNSNNFSSQCVQTKLRHRSSATIIMVFLHDDQEVFVPKLLGTKLHMMVHILFL